MDENLIRRKRVIDEDITTECQLHFSQPQEAFLPVVDALSDCLAMLEPELPGITNMFMRQLQWRLRHFKEALSSNDESGPCEPPPVHRIPQPRRRAG